MGWKIKTALCVLVVAAVNYGHGYYRWHTGPTCDEITYEEATKIVRNDLVRYLIPDLLDFQADRFGTDKPNISFGRDVLYTSEDVHGVSVTVSGPLVGYRMVAMVICRLGGVEYSAGTRIY